MQGLRAGAANYPPKKDLARDLAETIQKVLSVSTMHHYRRQLLQYLTLRPSTFQLCNDPNLIIALINLIQEEINVLGLFDLMGQIRVGITLQEALTNALFHGNLEVGSQLREDNERLFHQTANLRRQQEPYVSRQIHVVVRLDSRSATFIIRDEGPGFDTSRLNQLIEPGALNTMSGRGLLLIRSFMDDVVFNTTGNTITMIKQASVAEDMALDTLVHTSAKPASPHHSPGLGVQLSSVESTTE